MKIYAVIASVPYEGEWLSAVCSTREVAEGYIDAARQNKVYESDLNLRVDERDLLDVVPPVVRVHSIHISDRGELFSDSWSQFLFEGESVEEERTWTGGIGGPQVNVRGVDKEEIRRRAREIYAAALAEDDQR